jgi:hypothetical protein
MELKRDLDKMKNDDPEFRKWIASVRELNEKLEGFLNEKRLKWGKDLEPLFENLRHKSADQIIELQAIALSRRQMATEEIATYMNKLSKEMIKLKQAQADRFMFYTTGYGIKTNTGEKKIMFDAELSEMERSKELLETQIEFLRDCKVSCDNIGWGIKNRIALMGILEN